MNSMEEALRQVNPSVQRELGALWDSAIQLTKKQSRDKRFNKKIYLEIPTSRLASDI
jgi:hypothetical protein